MDSGAALAQARELVSHGYIHEAAMKLDRYLLQYPRAARVRRVLSGLRSRFLLVDDQNSLFDTSGMRLFEFSSDYNQIRFYSLILTQGLPASLQFGRIMEQQVSEIVKNAIKHGNRGNILKKVRIWLELTDRVRYIVEDEGPGMYNLDEWNDFNRRRRNAMRENRIEDALALLTYRGKHSEENDGGNSLFAGLTFWDEGMIYNARKNKVVVLKNMP
ncbi:MAG: ATP-binding protein [Spirochaetes bacterium]|nr:ATP-binding protein [Spirochaetota bacterium]